MQKYSRSTRPTGDGRAISIRGRRGRGAVWLVPPPTAAEPLPIDDAATATRAPSSAPSLLVVEDDPLIATMLRSAFELEDAGWRVTFASDGRKALEAVRRATPDVILLDVNLPDMDGVEVFHRLRADQAARDSHIIFLTAATTVDLGVRGVDGGLLIRKPFDPATVIDLVGALLTKRAQSAPVG